MVSRFYLLLKGTRADYRIKAGKLQDEPELKMCSRNDGIKGYQKDAKVILKGLLQMKFGTVEASKEKNIVTNYNH